MSMKKIRICIVCGQRSEYATGLTCGSSFCKNNLSQGSITTNGKASVKIIRPVKVVSSVIEQQTSVLTLFQKVYGNYTTNTVVDDTTLTITTHFESSDLLPPKKFKGYTVVLI